MNETVKNSNKNEKSNQTVLTIPDDHIELKGNPDAPIPNARTATH